MPDARHQQAPYITTQAVDKLSGKASSLHQRNPREDRIASHQKDWDTRLSFAMSAYRASRHESTGYTPNMLTLGTEVTAPADIMYGSLNEPSSETYDDYVESMRERMITAYEQTRAALRRAAERNKRYYDIRVRAKEYKKDQWVYYFNPRKFVGRQDKWERKYTGPFLIVDTPSPVTVQIQRCRGAKTMTVHIDKVKPFLGEVQRAGSPTSRAPTSESSLKELMKRH